MKDRLEELLDKYWLGETSIKEEAELKTLLKKSSSYPELSGFFSGIDQLAQIDMDTSRSEKLRKIGSGFFLKIAAVFVGLLFVGGMLYKDYHKREQEKAYLQVMEAFALIQSNMERGSKELLVLDQLRHLNLTHELFNVSELNEQ